MIDAKRVNLPNAGDGKPLHHPGLALHRYLKAHNDEPQDGKKDEKRSVKSLFEAVEKSPASEAYKTAFNRWEKTMREAGVVVFSMELAGPLAVGLGNASPMEIGLTTHHTYGMPTIPGSALKGMCARAAREFKNAGTIDCKQYEAMFGDTNSAAYLTFWDAWYDPTSVNGLPFHRDVITVHHQKYYQDGKEWPTDFDDPVPIPFLVVRPGARFCFALSVPEGWRKPDATDEHGKDFATQMLQYALCELGAGGKTNAGYGYFDEKSLYIHPLPPKPPHEEVWENCTLKKRQVKGAVEVSIQFKDTIIFAPQNKWQVLELGISKEAREQLKKKPLIADVTVRIHGSETAIIKITPLKINGETK